MWFLSEWTNDLWLMSLVSKNFVDLIFFLFRLYHFWKPLLTIFWTIDNLVVCYIQSTCSFFWKRMFSYVVFNQVATGVHAMVCFLIKIAQMFYRVNKRNYLKLPWNLIYHLFDLSGHCDTTLYKFFAWLIHINIWWIVVWFKLILINS